MLRNSKKLREIITSYNTYQNFFTQFVVKPTGYSYRSEIFPNTNRPLKVDCFEEFSNRSIRLIYFPINFIWTWLWSYHKAQNFNGRKLWWICWTISNLLKFYLPNIVSSCELKSWASISVISCQNFLH